MSEEDACTHELMRWLFLREAFGCYVSRITPVSVAGMAGSGGDLLVFCRELLIITSKSSETCIYGIGVEKVLFIR